MGNDRVYNFSAGPSMLPLEVLERAGAEITNYQGSGMSVMEMSHRSKAFMEIHAQAEEKLRRIMNIPEGYKPLFLQTGATGQFAAIPLNLMGEKNSADYADTGNFAHLAAEEAKKYGEVRIAASSREDGYTFIPRQFDWNPDAAYAYITTNNTIYGTRYTFVPDTGSVPLVADMSSNILSEPTDVSKFGVIFAGAQKNIGPAGLCVAIIREELLGQEKPFTPKLLSWALEAKNGSMLNTPNTYGIYMAKLVFEWLRDLGGVPAIYERNVAKAAILYDYLDESRLFRSPGHREDRSLMNVPFVTGNADRDAAFVKYAAARGLVNLKGHRSVGGMRASIYNAMPIEGVKALVDFMKQYEAEVAHHV